MQSTSGTMALNGRVRGKINGYVDGEFKGVLTGQLNALVSTKEEKGDNDEKESQLDGYFVVDVDFISFCSTWRG